jgi:hypothetical protein
MGQECEQGRFTGDGTGPAPGTGWTDWPGPTAQWRPGGGLARFFPDSLLFDFLHWSENFKGSLNKEMRFLKYSFSDYLFDRIVSSGTHPI